MSQEISYQMAYATLCDELSDVAGLKPSQMRPEATLYDLEVSGEEYQLALSRACDRLGRNLGQIVSTFPLYAVGAGDWTMTSLQNWAAFSRTARSLLLNLNVREQIDSLDSIAQTLVAERYVPSGKTGNLAYPPRSKRYVALWTIGTILVFGVLVPMLFSLRSCGRSSFLCERPNWSAAWDAFPVFGAIGLAILAAAFVPGALALRRDRRRRQRRGVTD